MSLLPLSFLVLFSLSAQQAVLAPRLLLETPAHPIRDIAVSADGAVFTFDYDEYRIRKHGRDGRFLLEFGGTGKEEGRFTHLTGIGVSGDRLLAVDSVGLSRFGLDGRFLDRKAFAAEVTPNYSAVLEDGRYVGCQIVAPELKGVLTLRSPDGRELDRLASYDLRESFPGLKAGEDFFLSDDCARNYLYAIGPANDVLWAATDSPRVFRYRDGKSQPIVEESLAPEPLAEEERATLAKRAAALKPPLFFFVPTHRPVLRHLGVDSSGDLWVYVRSREKTGFLRYGRDGKAKGLVTGSAGFDVSKATVRVFGETMYFIAGRALYVADLP